VNGDNLLDTILHTLLGLSVGAVAWLFKRHMGRVDALEAAKERNASRISQIRTWIRTKFGVDPVSEGD